MTNPVLCLQGCFRFTEVSAQGTGHSDCASWGWLVAYLRPAGFPVTCRRGPAHRSLSGPEPMTGIRQSAAPRPPPTFCSICSQSGVVHLRLPKRVDLTCSHHTHTHTHAESANYVRSHTPYLPWLCWSFHNVCFYQNIKVYTLNTYNFYLSVTSQ